MVAYRSTTIATVIRRTDTRKRRLTFLPETAKRPPATICIVCPAAQILVVQSPGGVKFEDMRRRTNRNADMSEPERARAQTAAAAKQAMTNAVIQAGKLELRNHRPVAQKYRSSPSAVPIRMALARHHIRGSKTRSRSLCASTSVFIDKSGLTTRVQRREPRLPSAPVRCNALMLDPRCRFVALR